MWSDANTLLGQNTDRNEEQAHFSYFSRHWPDTFAPTPHSRVPSQCNGQSVPLQWCRPATGSALIAALPPHRPARFTPALVVVLSDTPDGVPTHADGEWARVDSAEGHCELAIVMDFNSNWGPGHPRREALVAALQITTRVVVYARVFDTTRADLLALNSFVWRTPARTFYRALPRLQ